MELAWPKGEGRGPREYERTHQCQCTQGEAKVKHEIPISLAPQEAGENLKETESSGYLRNKNKGQILAVEPEAPRTTLTILTNALSVI